MLRLKDQGYLERAQKSDVVMSQLRRIVADSEDVIDDIDDEGRSRCDEGPIKKPLFPSQHYRKPSSRRKVAKPHRFYH